MPVPVITQTIRPSVIGEGEDIFCFRFISSPDPSGRFQECPLFCG
jgi:hypothetical protein